MPQLVFSNGSVVSGAQPSFLTGITDLQIVHGPAGPMLLATTRAGGGVTGFAVGAQGLTETARMALGEDLAMVGTPHLQQILLGGEHHVIVAGLNAVDLFSVTPTTGGGLSDVNWLGVGGLDMRQVSGLASGAGTYAFAALRDGKISSLEISAGGTLHEVARMIPEAGHRVSDMLTMSRGGQEYLISAFATDDKISAFRVGADGTLQRTDDLGAANGLWINAPGKMIAVSVGGVDYVVVASALSSSLSVLRLETGGQLTAVDHVIDDLGTRFQGVSALDAIEIDGRTYLVAGGADDGLSLFSVLPGGQLLHHDSFADQVDTALTNVASVALAARGRQMQVFGSGAFDIGISQLTVDLGPAGQVRVGAAADGILSGGAGADVLAGQGGADDLRAGGGDDIIMDGAGADTLTGGAGADVFVLERDGATDLITDFQLGTDLLDLSRLTPHLSGSRMVVLSLPNGAEIYMDDEVLILHSANGKPLSHADIMDHALLDMSRLSLDEIAPSDISLSATAGDAADHLIGTNANDVLRGSAGDDRIEGRAGNDRLLGDTGADLLKGGAGFDTLEGGDGNDTLEGGLGLDFLFGNAGNDLLRGNERRDVLIGGAGDDTLEGGGDHDTLRGSWQNDVLYGGDGNDQIFGDDHNDTLYGGSGFDRLDGGSGDDLLVGGLGLDFLFGNAGNDLLQGNEHRDTLIGGGGNDTLEGGSDHDVLRGAWQDDVLYGGDGNDALFGDDHDDVLYGDSGFDTLQGGSGDDLLVGGYGIDLLVGDAGQDTLLGGGQRDRLFGGGGRDLLNGGADDDRLYGQDQADNLMGGSGADTLDGGNGNDRLAGGDGNDLLIGGTGFDVLRGGTGNDRLLGGLGIDRLQGDVGFDTLDGGGGDDILIGGLGADRFVFSGGFGRDEITDFEVDNPHEMIDLSRVSEIVSYDDLSAQHMSQRGGNVVIQAGNDRLTLCNVDLGDLGSDDFIF